MTTDEHHPPPPTTAFAKKIWITALLIFGGSLGFLAINLGVPTIAVFDEMYYVPAAKALLASNATLNPEHPPLGKYLIALGGGFLGDEPHAWRLMPIIFGALALVGLFFWLNVLLCPDPESPKSDPQKAYLTALLGVGFTLLNQVHFVQARTAMLDIFAATFVIWSALAFTLCLSKIRGLPSPRALIYATGSLMGLALASKWVAVVGLFVLGALTVRYRKLLLPKIGRKHLLMGLMVVPGLIYWLSYLPLTIMEQTSFNPWNIVSHQFKVLSSMSQFSETHTYSSPWWHWPFMWSPVWYAMEPDETRSSARFVLFLGNPFIMWPGIMAVGYSLYRAILKQSSPGLILSLFYLCFLFFFFFFGRGNNIYYYYFPAATILGPLLALVYFYEWPKFKKPISVAILATHLTLAAAFFGYFYPLSAGQSISAREYPQWIWLDSWHLRTKDGKRTPLATSQMKVEP